MGRKKKALRKDFFVEIKRSPNRFISLFLIVALGVAFYSGVRASNPDMKLSGDYYYDQSNLMDIRVLSTLGLTEDDLVEISKVEGVKEVEQRTSVNVLCLTGEKQFVLEVFNLPKDINQLDVINGRLPTKPDECFVDEQFIVDSGHKIGDKIQIKSGDKNPLSDSLNQEEFTIVGYGSTSYYLTFQRGTSNIGSGNIDSFICVLPEVFEQDVYTQVFATVEGAKELTSYYEEYDNLVESVVKNIETIADARCEVRYQDVMKEANDKIAEAEIKLEDAKQEANKELSDAKEKLDSGEKEIKDAEDTLASKEAELEKGKSELSIKEQDLIEAKNKLNQGIKDYEAGVKELKEQEELINDKEEELNASLPAFTKAKNQVEASRKEFDNQKEELSKKQAQIDAAKEQLKEGRTKLEANQKQLLLASEQLETAKQTVATLEPLVLAGTATKEQIATYETLKQTIATEEPTLIATKQQLEAVKEQLDASELEIEEAMPQILAAQQLMDEKETQLIEAEKTIAKKDKLIKSGKAQIVEGKNKLKEAKITLQTSKNTIEASKVKLSDGEKALSDANKTIKDAEDKIKEAKEELSEAKKEWKKGKEEYEEGKATAKKEISDASKKIDDAKEEVEKLSNPEWYVLDRNSLQPYMEYGQNADRIGAIGEIFPVIFFLVAALISLTTMTRMVEEQRTQIGTLKALGYRKGSIAGKYLCYALIASLGGSVFGVLIGQWLFPWIIINAYKILYTQIPKVLTPINIYYAVTATIVAVFCTTFAAFMACYKELMEQPAQLMRPTAPKQGRRTIFERIPFFWNRLNFTKKATIRNLIRYKKRFFMTIIGIGGCMGLLLVGFGLHDSIYGISEKQFGKITLYDGIVTLNTEADEEEQQQVLDTLHDESLVSEYLRFSNKSVDVGKGKKQSAAILTVPESVDALSDYILLNDRVYKTSYTLKNDGVIITEKLASLIRAEVGDEIYLKNDNTKRIKVKVSAICENYLMHYVYMSPDLYRQVYGEEPEINQIYLKMKSDSIKEEETVAEELLTLKGVNGVSFNTASKQQLKDMLKSLNMVVYVLIVSAGLLAFVVLYNLNNININERKRELATIKLLGFYDLELAAYVYRENVILTAIGSALGCVIGGILHQFVIQTAELDILMFGRNIHFSSFIYSILLTFAFSIVVNVAMYYSLKKIDMVSSLKSVE